MIEYLLAQGADFFYRITLVVVVDEWLEWKRSDVVKNTVYLSSYFYSSSEWSGV